MSNTLKSLLLEENRSKVISDCVEVINGEISKKKGISGLLIKGGFKVVSSLDGGRFLEKAVNSLIDEFVGSIESYYTKFEESGQAKYAFKDHIVSQSEAVTNSLLGVTDARRNRAEHKLLIKTYDKLRPVAHDNVKESLPALSLMIQKYLP